MSTLLNNKFFVLFLAPFLLGAATILSFSPINFTIVNFICFPILLFLISIIKEKTKSKFRKKKSNIYFFYLGCAFGFGFFLFGNYWISISLTHDITFKNLIPFALILIPLFLSIFFGFAILIIGKFAEKSISFILLFSLVFSVFEFLRGNLLTGFPWNLIAYSWSWLLESLQVLSIIGTYSFSLISITFFCLPFIFLKKKIDKKELILFMVFLFLFIGNYFYGSHKIKSGNYNYDKDIFVKVISPSISLEEYNTNKEILLLKKLIKYSNPEKNKKTLFIWPEGIFYESNLNEIKKYKSLFSNNFSKNHLIILGINNFGISKNDEKKKYYNSLVIFNNELEVLATYEKMKLVPFGEFLPLENILSKFGLRKITRGYNSFSPGKNRDLINLGEQFNERLIIPIICYEIIYPGNLKSKKQLPDLVINISEDAWFGESIGPYQHYAKAIYRSIEEGVFIARSANKGTSGFIDPNGKSIKILNRSESGNIEYKMPHFNKSTLYSLYGNKIFFLIVLVYIFLILFIKKLRMQ